MGHLESCRMELNTVETFCKVSPEQQEQEQQQQQQEQQQLLNF